MHAIGIAVPLALSLDGKSGISVISLVNIRKRLRARKQSSSPFFCAITADIVMQV
jgi:hypothetical protein